MASLTDDDLEKDKADSPANNVQNYINRTLEGKNPIVQNAQAQQNTASAVQKYIADRSAKNTSAQAGFDPGTLQYQRTQDRATAAADQSILQGQNQVNDLTRQTSQQALSDKSKLDAAAIQSVEDPQARAYLQSVLASGGDVQSALTGMYEGGVLKPEYASPTAGEQLRLDAEDIIKNTYPDLVPGTPEFEAAVNERLQSTDRATQGSIGKTVSDAEIADVRHKAVTGQPLTEGDIEILNKNTRVVADSAIPSSSAAVEALVNSDDPFIKLQDGQTYQVMDYYQQKRWDRSGGYSDRHNDWVVVKNIQTGEMSYVSSSGDRVNYTPPSAPSGKKIQFKNGRFETTDGNSYYDPQQNKWVGNFKQAFGPASAGWRR